MCGIAGVVDPAGAPDLDPALAALTHRGPDDEGRWQGPGVAFGARRLSIIDVAGGHQPLTNEDGTVVAIQNGEIYNYVELITELQGLGHRFRSDCDTEVLVHAWEAWGPECVQRFRGMFALAIYDVRQQCLFLARDRFGIKPLYVHQTNRRLAFASELPALLALLPSRPTLNPSPLPYLLSLGWVPGPETLYEGINSLAPGHALLATRTGVSTTRYWKPTPPAAGARVRPTALPAQHAEALDESVRLHLRSDVPVGALLSGGLDSSLLVAMMRRTGHPDLHTFNIGFEDTAYDETPYARLAAEHLEVRHHTLRFGTEAFDLLPALVASYGQPVGSATHVAIWLLYRACAEAGLKVILTGEGADELFGGYQWYRGETDLLKAQRWPQFARSAAARLAGLLGISPAAAALLRQPDPSGLSPQGRSLTIAGRYARWLSPVTYAAALDLLNPDIRRACMDRIHHAAELGDRQPAGAGPFPWPEPPLHTHPLHALTLLDVHSRLPDFINLEVDRMSMAHSVEARVPYLDHALWEAVLSWDPSLNLAGGRNKDMLRQVAAPFLPAAILQRRKQGLASPHARWWRQGRLPDWVMAKLEPAALSATGLFQPAAVSGLLASHRAGRGNSATQLTAILSTQIWAGVAN